MNASAATQVSAQACLHQLFEAQAARTPEAVAVLFEAEEICYAELNRRADQLARRLRRLGVGPDVLVGICLERSVELVVGLLAILKAGGAYVPLDPDYPRDRLEYMLEDSRLGVLLTQQRLLELLPKAPIRLCLDASREVAASAASADTPVWVHADNLAYVIYTSGSTGRPKGAMNTHSSIVNRLLWMQEAYRLDESDRVLQKTPASFDVSVWEFFWPLLAGASLVVARPGSQRDAAYLAEVIQRRAITTLHFVPSMLRAFLEHPGVAACRSLRRVIASGEALSAELQERFFERLDAELFNLYGPTETAVDVTSWRCRRDPKLTSIPIGSPISNAYVRILDPELRPVPAGGVGELHIGGRPVGRGYWGRPDLTAERFVPDPCSDEAGARLYKSGDLARCAPDSAFEYLGRLDDQVKLRGFRIELGEIEAVLAEYPGVVRSVVAAREFEGDSRLVAYVVKADLALDGGALKEFLRGKLPEYMVPSHVMFLKTLPVGPSGKLDRRALPEPPESHDAARGYVAPSTPREQALAEIWSEVLGVRRVGRLDDFFELGGHSLLVLKVLSRVRERWGLELPLGALFECPTLAAQAVRIEAGTGDEAWPALMPAPREGPLPLSFPQEQAWFMQQLEPGSRAYQSQAVLRFDGPLDVRALERALQELVRRHEILRTTFPAVEGRPTQVVHEPWNVFVPVVDLRSLPGPAREAEAQRLVDAFIRRQFELDRLPLIRWTLLKLDDACHWLVHAEHHLVHDGWSFTVFLRELAEVYRAFAAGQRSPLQDPVLQFADFAVWQRRTLSGTRGESQQAYWTRKLASVPQLLDLPTDRARPRKQSFRGAAPRFQLPPEIFDGLMRLSRREGVTLFMTMFAGFLTLLRRYTHQDDLCVGSGVANRRWRETEALLGMIINTVALRVDLSRDPSFRELLGRVRETTLEALAHQDLPFRSVVAALNPDRSPSHPPVYQVLFSFHDPPVGPLDLGGLTLTVHEAVSNGSAKFDINVIVVPRSERLAGVASGDPHGITLIWEHNSDLFDSASMERMFGHYRMLLEGALADPGCRISDLPLLNKRESERILVDWNATASEHPEACVHELISAQARRTPERVAVECVGEALSYGVLEERSERLAKRLRGLDVGPDVRVGILLERSPELVVGVLGVLRAGGAYVPLDPAYPPERLAYMVEDSGTSLVLSGPGLAEVLPKGVRVVSLDAAEARGEGGEPDRQAMPENLAYVIYTSGSTGRPKGVSVTHRALVNLLMSAGREPGVAERDVWLAVTALSFDIAGADLYLPLLAGGRVVLASREEAADGVRLLQKLRGCGATVMSATPWSWRLLLDAGWSGTPGLKVLCSGEALSRELAGELLERAAEVWNLYGPTETTIWSSAWRVTDPERVSIGRPLSNTRMYVLDGHLRPLPVGVPGELCIGGDGLARGYWRRPELTAQSFVPDPFGAKAGGRLYRTGDLARRLADGRLEYLGRLDQQVKLRGFRIEPAEIEAALDRHPGVERSLVLTRPDATGVPSLVAYVIPREAAAPVRSELRRFLAQVLPEFMVPSLFVFLKAFPLTPNGKLDRRALPPPDSRPLVHAATPPHNDLERMIAEVWQKALGLAEVGVHDNFFDLGGHSLLLARVQAELRSSLGQELPLVSLFESPTISALARRLGAEQEPVARSRPAEAPRPKQGQERFMELRERRRRLKRDKLS